MSAGRPIKSGVDYFPLEVSLCDKFELIESEHGIVGFGVVIKLYQKIYADNYYINWDKKALLVFSNRINVDINTINAVINSCLEWGVFDNGLYGDFGVLTSIGIQKRFFEIVKRRKLVEYCKDYMLIKIDINAYKKLINVSSNSQRKGKGKERKEEKNTKKKIYSELKNYLFDNIPESLKDFEEDIISFYDYRMNMPKKKQYRTVDGINGLFRDLLGCFNEKYKIPECVTLTKENDWLTPRVKYFKDSGILPPESNYESISDYKKRKGLK